MKKITMLLLITIAIVLLTACSGSGNKTAGDNLKKDSENVVTNELSKDDKAVISKDDKSGASSGNDILGTWERTGDIHKGMQVKIEKQDSHYKSSIVKIPEGNTISIFTIGVEKWKDIAKKANGLWTFKDYGLDKDKKETWYEMDMKLSDNGSTLELSDINKEGKETGSKQIWKKMDAAK